METHDTGTACMHALLISCWCWYGHGNMDASLVTCAIKLWTNYRTIAPLYLYLCRYIRFQSKLNSINAEYMVITVMLTCACYICFILFWINLRMHFLWENYDTFTFNNHIPLLSCFIYFLNIFSAVWNIYRFCSETQLNVCNEFGISI